MLRNFPDKTAGQPGMRTETESYLEKESARYKTTSLINIFGQWKIKSSKNILLKQWRNKLLFFFP